MTSTQSLRTFLCCVIAITCSASLRAQGDTCTTALPVITGIHLADGPDSGDGQGGVAGCGSGQDGDWYTYSPSFTGTITITSCHPLNNNMDDDTYVKVFTGECGALTCLGFNDDMGAGGSCPGYAFASFLEVQVTAGETYYIVWVDTFDDDAFYWELSECAGTVAGVTYRDANTNGTRETGEGQVDVMLQIEPGGLFSAASSDPYSFCSELGTYTVSVPNPPLYHTVVPATQSYSINTQGDQITGFNFALQPTPGIYDASVALWGWDPWIGNNTTLHVSYANIGTETVDATVSLTLDPLLSYVEATVPETSMSGQVVTWGLGPLAPGSSGTITVTIFTSIEADPNAPVSNSVAITTDQVDINAGNDGDVLNGIATTAYDPNDKRVDFETITPDDVLESKPLEYIIRFQNTGNAPAVNVVIKDSLDGDWDLGTFEMVGATHPYTVTVTNEVAIWTFANIFLPDSFVDPLGSIGSFHYRMAPKSTLVLGDQLTNRADIYFDYNDPVLTNTTVTTVALPTGIDAVTVNNGLRMHPSPSDGQVNITWTRADVANAQLIVLDALGRVAATVSLNQLVAQSTRTIDLSTLAPGTYTAWLQGNGTDARGRFMIQR
jgi:uncharacterized repeat protein (TIGR01451 family)